MISKNSGNNNEQCLNISMFSAKCILILNIFSIFCIHRSFSLISESIRFPAICKSQSIKYNNSDTHRSFQQSPKPLKRSNPSLLPDLRDP